MNENGIITTNPSEIQAIIRILWKIICQQTGQPGRNGQFLNTHTLSKLKREKIENLNRPITSEEIKSVIKNLPKK